MREPSITELFYFAWKTNHEALWWIGMAICGGFINTKGYNQIQQCVEDWKRKLNESPTK